MGFWPYWRGTQQPGAGPWKVPQRLCLSCGPKNDFLLYLQFCFRLWEMEAQGKPQGHHEIQDHSPATCPLGLSSEAMQSRERSSTILVSAHEFWVFPGRQNSTESARLEWGAGAGPQEGRYKVLAPVLGFSLVASLPSSKAQSLVVEVGGVRRQN